MKKQQINKVLIKTGKQKINTLLMGMIFMLVTTAAIGQSIDYNNDSYIANGYDVVSYFSNKAVKGSKQYAYNHNGAKFIFSSSQNLATFKENPAKYTPQYGGWCAYAMASKGEKVSINPKTFEVRKGKLYLFYNKYFTNTFDSWKKEGPEKLKAKADGNWDKVKYKK